MFPLTVSEKFVVPAAVVVGLIVVITGIGFRIVKGTAFVGFACAGSVTVTEAAPPFCNWAGRMVAVQEVGVGQVVANEVVVPLTANFTTEVAVNPLPFTVRVRLAAAPALAENGEIEAMLNAPAPPRFRSQTPRP